MYRDFLCLAFAMGLLIPVSAQDRPNVVLILTDNHGAWTLGCYGNPDIRTPNIDRLAEEGTLFTRAFASNPVCSPTRATLLTGLVPSQHGVHSFLSGGGLQTGPQARCTLDEFTSLPEILRDEGYACGLVGKWHLGANLSPQEGLDDYWITMPHGGTSTFYDANVIENGKIRKEPQYLTDFWTDHAVQFINEQSKVKEKPFFLFLAYNGPYALSRLLLRPGQNRHAEFYADKELPSFPRVTPHPWQLNNRDFINNPISIQRVATEVSGVDDGVGEVMRALKAQGLDDNTIVVFVADQGWVGGHGGFFGMGDHTRPLTARDGMMQIPLIWRHPGKISSGLRSDQMIANYDVLPTMLGHLGLNDKMPASPISPGADMSPLLAGKPLPKQSTNDDTIHYEFENLRCIRTTSHKYVHRHPNGPHELYDLKSDPNEFLNLANAPEHDELRSDLKSRLDAFYAEHSLPKYDMWNGGTSQVRIHDGIDEEMAQLANVDAPPLPNGFSPAPLTVPEGYSVELVAGPPLITHPTMGCFDDRGRLYVCNNSGVNLSNEELEAQLPNSIRRLVDEDGDGTFDSYTVFADKMTFPMGGAWHDGSLYVASPPNIWKLTDTDDDGVADQRAVIVTQFGYNGNAASIHGCFIGPDGRVYWTDGYHGHEFKDGQGNVTSKREGSYIFSCLPDGSDKRIHCGGGMDNPVELDFTDSGDMLGTVNILYTRPRVDCLVHWLHGGAYPHREKVLKELQVTGDVLGPVHRFGHVAISGMTRYRSGTMDHRFGDNLFATFFNSGKVVRLEVEPAGSSYTVTQHEFLSSSSREFHPTDVMEDADGSLLVVDTGGWFYRGCPTSQFAKPDLLGGIYRVRRNGMTTMVDPRGLRIDWSSESPASVIKMFNDTRHEVRASAVDHCVTRGAETLPTLKTLVVRGDIRIRQNAVSALARIAQQPDLAAQATAALKLALKDVQPVIRQAACRALSFSASEVDSQWLTPLLQDSHPGVRRQAAATIGVTGDGRVLPALMTALSRVPMDRSEEHAIVYAMIEIGDADAVRRARTQSTAQVQANSQVIRGVLIALDQITGSDVQYNEFAHALNDQQESTQRAAVRIARQHPEWASNVVDLLRDRIRIPGSAPQTIRSLIASFIDQPVVAEFAGTLLTEDSTEAIKWVVLDSIASSGKRAPHPSWIAPLRRRLQEPDEMKLDVAIAAAAAMRGDHFRSDLAAIADNVNRSIAIRMNALSAVALRTGKLDAGSLDRLIELYEDSGSPTATARAAQIIGAASLTSEQLIKIAPLIESASPAELRDLMKGFSRSVKTPVAAAFLDSIEQSKSWKSLAEHELSDVIKRFPKDTLGRCNQLLDVLKAVYQQKRLRLERLRAQLSTGDSERGKAVFHGQKAKCNSCHRIGPEGKAVGPDLTTIGSNRTANDLLESIVFPSASIVRDYESRKVLTVDGRALTGLVVKETATEVHLQQANGDLVTLKHSDIEQIEPSSVSIMPAGLEEALSEQELIDVVRYLQSKN
ncbi:MAG: PVC-type heme-binding CxxCH protein [Rubripirellula sp.]